MNIRNNLTPVNFSPGRVYLGKPVTVGGIVLHTEQGYEAGSVSWFKNPDSSLSANYGIALDGSIDLIVAEGDTAWANGNWQSNCTTISIEHEDNDQPDTVTRTDAQYESSAQLVADICRRYRFPADRDHIKGHKEVPPFTHPDCPGDLDVDRIVNRAAEILAEAKLPLPAPAGIQVHDFVGEVKIINSVLQVRTAPNTSAPGNQANTRDGLLHAGDIADVVGFAVGEDPYGDGRNVWYKSFRGKWFWAGGTNAPNPHVEIAPAVPTTPEPSVPAETPLSPAEPVQESVTPEPTPEPAPVVEETPVETPVETTTVPDLVSHDVSPASKVVAVEDTVIIDFATGEAVAQYKKGGTIEVVKVVEYNGDWLQTANMVDKTPTWGLPATSFIEVQPPNKGNGRVDSITTKDTNQPSEIHNSLPTLEETLSQTNNFIVRTLLRIFHHTKK